jgi:hypothetical protein
VNIRLNIPTLLFSMRRLPLVAYLLVLWTSFTGALTAGLGQGFDLGTEWPGALYRLVESAAGGSFEPIHRLSTVVAGVAVAAFAVRYWRQTRLWAAGALLLLVATALTGRMVLLALGGQVPPPWSFFVYPVNNFFALLTAFFLLAAAVDSVDWRRSVLLRGAAFWSVVASLSGAYMLGLHKIQRVPFQYQLAPTLDSAPLLLHIAAAFLAVSLAVAASMRVGSWVGRVLAAAAVMQAATGGLMYLGATGDSWAPGPQTALHTVFAHVMATTSAVAYIKKR